MLTGCHMPAPPLASGHGLVPLGFFGEVGTTVKTVAPAGRAPAGFREQTREVFRRPWAPGARRPD